MRLSSIQRKLLIALVSSLILAAVLALTVVLTGDLSETGTKVLLTTISLATFSITAMASSVPSKRDAFRLVAPMGLVSSIAAFALSTYFTWGEPNFETATFKLAKLLAILIIIAVASAHTALLQRGTGHGSTTDTVVTGTLLCTGTLTLLLIGALILEEFPDGFARLIGALAILGVLGTLLTPLLPRILDTTNSPGTE